MSCNSPKSPIKNIPPCWEDDKRMNVLYSPFRMREVNPVDYDSKMKFWHKIILEWCMEKNVCVFNIKIIQDEFRRNGRAPLGLKTVMDNLQRDGKIQRKVDFLNINPEESWTEWAVNSLVKTPVVWSFSKLKMALIEIDENAVDYISTEFLKIKSDQLISKTDGRQKLFDRTELLNMLKTPDGEEMPQETFDILLKWMQINKTIRLIKVEDNTLVKFTNGKKVEISEVEISIHVLEKNKISFEKAITALEEEKEELVLTAKSYLKKGMRDAAKSYLRRKKEVEKTIAKRVSALENIEILLSKIHVTSMDSKVLDTYKTALNALKKSFRDSGLSEDEVTNTVSEIQEINEMHEEIQEALALPVSEVGETELEDELKDILAGTVDIVPKPSTPPRTPAGTLRFPEVPDLSPGKETSSASSFRSIQDSKITSI